MADASVLLSLEYQRALQAACGVLPEQLWEAAVAVAQDEGSGTEGALQAFLAGLVAIFPSEVNSRLSAKDKVAGGMQYLLSCAQRADVARSRAQHGSGVASFLADFRGATLRVLAHQWGQTHSRPPSQDGPNLAKEILPVTMVEALGKPDSLDPLACTGDLLEALIDTFAQFGPAFSADMLQEAFVWVLHRKARGITLANYHTTMTALMRVVQTARGREMLLDADMWLCDRGTKNLARTQGEATLLAPVLSVSVFPDTVTPPVKESFDRQFGINPTPESVSAMDVFRGQMAILHKALERCFVTLLKHDKAKQRHRVMDYFVQFCSANAKRGQLQNLHFQGENVPKFALEGFSHNICAVLLRLCAPFIATSLKATGGDKFAKLDAAYLFRPASRIDVSTDDRMGDHDPERFQSWLTQHPPREEQPHFITECFFLTLKALHVGVIPTILKFNEQFLGPRGQLQRVQRLSPALQAQIQETVNLLGQQFCAYLTHLMNPSFVAAVLDLGSFTATWLLHITNPRGLEDWASLSEEDLSLHSALPAWILEDLAEYLLFVTARQPQLLDAAGPGVARPIARLFVMCCSSTKFTKNPYLRSKLVQFLAQTAPELLQARGRPQRSAFFATLCADAFSIEHLAPAIMAFYVDIEDTDPYSRYSRRYYATVILKNLCTIPVHRGSIRKEGANTETFLRFVMLLINDTTYLMDEARDLLTKITELKGRLAAAEANSQEARELQGQVTQHEGLCQSQVLFAKESIEMMRHLTQDVIAPFLRPEVVDRLAGMLNYNLNALLSLRLEMEDYKRIGLDPHALLSQLLDIYLQLSAAVADLDSKHDPAPFLAAVVRDGRSYDRELFAKACYIISRTGQRKGDHVQALIGLLSQAEEDHAATEVILGDIPAEFLDPILDTLMQDPVVLPSSKQVVDRSMIVQHLLSDPTDPFNRAPLSLDDLEPATELKGRIEAWVRAQRAKQPAAK